MRPPGKGLRRPCTYAVGSYPGRVRDFAVGRIANMGWAPCVQDGQRISVGDCVELQPTPGETLPIVAQLQALWSERPADGQERMLARVCRFYRPQVLLAADTHTSCLLKLHDSDDAPAPCCL